MTVYVLLSCMECESDVLLDVYASLEAAQAARPGRWRALGADVAWTTRPFGWGASTQWHAIEAREVRT